MSKETREQVQAIIDDPAINPNSKTHMLLGAIIGLIDEQSERRNMDRGPDLFQDIVDFHVKFNQEYGGPVRALPRDMQRFRSTFLNEELAEYEEAVEEGNLVGQIDALFDLVYVALGTAYLMGVDFPSIWREGQASNMSKELVAKGKGKLGFTVHKGDNYFKPNFEQFVPVNLQQGLTIEKIKKAGEILSQPQRLVPDEPENGES